MGVCIDKLPHSCGTRKGLQVFVDDKTGVVNGFCFSCKTFVSNPYGQPKTIDQVDIPPAKTEEEIAAEMAEVSGYTVVDLPSRKLRADDLKRFGMKVSLSEEDGKTPTALYSPMYKGGKLSGYYVKTISKPSYLWSIGDVKKTEPFGWQIAKKSGAYKLVVTEGHIDTVTVDKLYRQYGNEEWLPAVISLPNGVNSVKSLAAIASDIRRLFREVVFCFDNDEEGQDAVAEAMLILPEAKSVILPEKDANDCLVAGGGKAAYKALRFQAESPKNTRLIWGHDLHKDAREPTPFGELTWPYPTMNKLLRNIRYGETIYIGAGVKMGKSELLNDIGAHIIKEHGVPVFMAKPEEANKKTYKLICNKMVGKVFHDPSIPFDYEAYDRAGEMLKDKLLLVNLYQHLGWETLKSDIVSAASSGAKAIFIDPITNLTNGMNAADANTKLQEIAQDLASMAMDLNVVIFIFCHLKEPEGNISKKERQNKYDEHQYVGLGNCPHERGGDVLASQFAGSRGMMRSCNLMLGLEGNKDPDLGEEVRSLRWLSILEDREFGNSAKVKLHWNKNTTFYREV